MIAPYQGDQPPQALINAELIFAYPAIGFVQMRDIAIDEDSYTHEQRLNAREFVTSASLEAPSGFGAAAMNQSIDTAWTKRSNEILDGYQIVWRKLSSDRRAIRTSDRASDQEWHTASVGAHQFAYHVPDLENNALYELSVRSFRYTPTGTQVSPLSLVQHVRPSEHLTSQTINSVSPNLKLLTLAIEMVVKQTLLRDPDKQNNIDLNAQEISPEWKLKPSRFFRRSLWP
jgi:hypothetical protein